VNYLFRFNERINDLFVLLKKTNNLLYSFLKDKPNYNEEELIKLLESVELLLNNLDKEIRLLKDLFEEIRINGYKFKDKNLLLLFYNYYFLLKERSFFLIKEELLFDFLEKLNFHIEKLKEVIYGLLDKIKNERLVHSILKKFYSIFSKEQSHLEYVINKTSFLIDNYNKIKINELIFTDLAVKKIKKYKDKDHIKILFLRLENLIREGLNSNRIRLFNRGLAKELGLIDYPNEHTRERFAIKPIYKNTYLDSLIVYDIFFDHMGKDKKDYEDYWKGKIKRVKKLEYLVLNKELLAFLLTKDSILIRSFMNIVRD